MIIKIPSQNIFPMQNQKVIDNEVDAVEANVKIPQPISNSQNVYNENIIEDNSGVFYDGALQPAIDVNTYYYFFGTAYRYKSIVAYIQEEPIYVTRTFTIPKQMQNSVVTRLFTGINDAGNANIKYFLTGNVKKGIAHGTVEVQANVDDSYRLPVNTQKENPIQNDPNVSYVLDSETLNRTYSITEAVHNNYRTSTATLNLDNKSTILSATATEDENNYIITLTVLSGVNIIELKGSGEVYEANVGENEWFTVNLNGNYEEYIPTQVSISFYGDTISLDLEDNTMVIGNGDNVISFTGNELIQDTNTPSVEETYQKVIDSWKNGKETATIKCNYDDFYSVPRNVTIKILDSRTYDNYKRLTMTSTDNIEIGEKLQLDDGTIIEVKHVLGEYVYGNVPLSTIVSLGTKNATSLSVKAISPYEQNLPMTFKIGDTVIPYVLGANGIDKPMSLNKDGTPKVFQVHGTNIVYDGAVWNTLSLQEKT